MSEINYKELHSKLDLIVAIWINQTRGMPSQATVLDLMTWYFRECQRQVDQDTAEKILSGIKK